LRGHFWEEIRRRSLEGQAGGEAGKYRALQFSNLTALALVRPVLGIRARTGRVLV